MDDNSTAPFLHQGTSVSQKEKSDLLTASQVVKPQGSTKAFIENLAQQHEESKPGCCLQAPLHNMLFQTPCKQPSSWTQEPKPSEMHHPAASITGPRSVIHDAANIPQPIRIPFSCNGGEHSWNYRVGPSPDALIVHYLSLVLKQ